MECGILVLWPGSNVYPLQWKCGQFNHWTAARKSQDHSYRVWPCRISFLFPLHVTRRKICYWFCAPVTAILSQLSISYLGSNEGIEWDKSAGFLQAGGRGRISGTRPSDQEPGPGVRAVAVWPWPCSWDSDIVPSVWQKQQHLPQVSSWQRASRATGHLCCLRCVPHHHHPQQGSGSVVSVFKTKASMSRNGSSGLSWGSSG